MLLLFFICSIFSTILFIFAGLFKTKYQPTNLKIMKVLRKICVVALLLIISSIGLRAQSLPKIDKGDIVIVYENDVHCAIDGYPKFVALRDEYKKITPNVLTVSNGDFVSGFPIGSISRGEYIIRIMKTVGYDYVTLGNHEFDHRIPQLQRNMELLGVPVLCCNFQSIATGKPVFGDYAIRKIGNKRIAFVGASTPSTPSSSSPIYFCDSLGNPAYTFCKDSLIEVIQRRVDKARAEGADYVIMLSHIGDQDDPPTSIDIAQQTTGIDVILDGHSHTQIPERVETNAAGKQVIITSTGTAFQTIGMLTISRSGKMHTQLIPTEELTAVNQRTADTVAAMKSLYEAIGNRYIGKISFTIPYDRETSREQEYQLCNLVADAYRVVLDAQIGIFNGGSVRKEITPGDIDFNVLYQVMPYNNRVMKARVSGQDIIDALEAASARVPYENGRFAQVSGLRYTINTTYPSTVVFDSNDAFAGLTGKTRVSDVQVLNKTTDKYEPIDPQATYTIAATDYVLNLMGLGAYFNSRVIITVDPLLDVEVLESYIADYLKGVVPERYKTTEGRITIIK